MNQISTELQLLLLGPIWWACDQKKKEIKNCRRSNWQRQTFRKNIQSIEKVIWMKTSHDRNCFFKTFFFQPCKVKYYGFQGSVICLIFANLPFLAPISTVQVNNYEIFINFFHIKNNLTDIQLLFINLPEFTQFVQF